MVVSGICMLETNVNNSSGENKADADFKTETKVIPSNKKSRIML